MPISSTNTNAERPLDATSSKMLVTIHGLKPYYYQDALRADRSFSTNEVKAREFGFGWHFHPEYQLKLTLCGQGYRLIGDNISPVEPGDLVFTGPNVPHAWRNDPGLTSDAVHFVTLLFREDCLGPDFFQQPEMAEIHSLLRRSQRGLHLRGETRRRTSDRMLRCLQAEAFSRVLILLELLHDLASSAEWDPITTTEFRPALDQRDAERMTRICSYLEQQFFAMV